MWRRLPGRALGGHGAEPARLKLAPREHSQAQGIVMPARTNTEFEIKGVNHLALVCKDMAKTVAFYRDVLGMPLIKTIDLPGGGGQHFFFDIGNGDTLAFFWF